MKYTTFGNDIDEGSHDQIAAACDLPIARAGALMPDAHLGYGLPIGGVLATENAVIPYGVGVDIACRMRLTLVTTDTEDVDVMLETPGLKSVGLANALRQGTRFGIGCNWKDEEHDHEVLESPVWGMTDHLKELKDTAWRQLGTSGSGNHFVEWGVVHASQELAKTFGITVGKYIALLSHSGSRGPGAKTCNKYTKHAKWQNPAGELSWLGMDTDLGREYWAAMQLMGEFAAANHECIHKKVLALAGLESCGVIENHHNFAWEENGLIVHRKGATPAQEGVLGIIPGSMASPAYIVVGKGNEASINSASHGAGRRMSRKQCKRELDWGEARADLKEKGIWLLDAGLDEMMGAYKDIDAVMSHQRDLVDTIGEFHPKIVLMCGDGSRPED
jgi:tRNA-splicing ligase RtcB